MHTFSGVGYLQVNKRKGEEYQLFWSEEPDFVRMAAKLNALIIPFASVGADEAFDIALDSDEVLQTPVLGNLMRTLMQRVDPSLDLSESVPPLTNLPGTSIPSLLPIPNLSRLYFRCKILCGNVLFLPLAVTAVPTASDIDRPSDASCEGNSACSCC